MHVTFYNVFYKRAIYIEIQMFPVLRLCDSPNFFWGHLVQKWQILMVIVHFDVDDYFFRGIRNIKFYP